ncbi:MAG: cytochrome c oxidase subunit II [Oligoflexales bacterium]
MTANMKEFLGFRLLPEVASAHGDHLDDIMLYLHILMIVLAVGWGLYLIVALFKFRAGRGHKADYHGVQSSVAKYIEIGVVVIEVVLLLCFSIPFWGKWVDAEQQMTNTEEENATVVRVVAQQFQWNFHYAGPDGKFGMVSPDFYDKNPVGLDPEDPWGADNFITQHEMHVPVGRRVVAYITSRDVIHGFGVPAMRVKQDATPGVNVPISWIPTKEGVYEIACSQLCGAGHGLMRGVLVVHSEDDYKAWLAQQYDKDDVERMFAGNK